jgi:hypothetical protein
MELNFKIFSSCGSHLSLCSLIIIRYVHPEHVRADIPDPTQIRENRHLQKILVKIKVLQMKRDY